MILALEAISVAQSTRQQLRPGGLFRVKRGSGPYLVHSHAPCGAEPGEYRCLSIWRDSKRPRRVYCDAVHSVSGRVHTLYLQGPSYRSHGLQELVIVPYRVMVLIDPNPSPRQVSTQRPRRTQRKKVS